jgi:hypothetical protein
MGPHLRRRKRKPIARRGGTEMRHPTDEMKSRPTSVTSQKKPKAEREGISGLLSPKSAARIQETYK